MRILWVFVWLALGVSWGWSQDVDTSWLSLPSSSATLLKRDSSALFRVDSIEFQIRDAFDDVVTHSSAEAVTYNLLNKLHIQTRESVVRKLLLFNKGDTVSLRGLIESERLLRSQKIFADAKIEAMQGSHGENILRVTTSDNWTTTVPFALSKPGSEWLWTVGLLENNILGFGQYVGVYYDHAEDRDSYLLRYGNPHFVFSNNRLDLGWAKTTDGFQGTLFLGKPFLSRARDEWAYTIEGLSQRLDRVVYWSGDSIPGLVALSGDSLAGRHYQPGRKVNPLLAWRGLREDSLSVRVGRSFGSAIKSLVRLTYDWHSLGDDSSQLRQTDRFIYQEGSEFLAVDPATASTWLPRKGDSRIGLLVGISRIRYERLRNFHRIKWTEDVDKGWNFTGAFSRNFSVLGAQDNRCFGLASMAIALGGAGNNHHLILKSNWQSYFAEKDWKAEEFYGRISGEYMYKSNDLFATVLNGQWDGWRRAPLGHQVTLGGLEGLNGLPTNLLAGQGRMLGGLEQRWFPGFELGTVVPVFAAFLNAGQTTESFKVMPINDLQVVTGLGVRLGMSKSVEGVINQINISWPVHGALPLSAFPRISVLASVAL